MCAVLTQIHIVKTGALPALVRLTALGREKLDVSRYCGMTLSNLACHRQNRVPVVQAGGLKPLCDMAFDGERLEMQRAAGLALYNLSCSAVNQVGGTRHAAFCNVLFSCHGVAAWLSLSITRLPGIAFSAWKERLFFQRGHVVNAITT